MGAPLKYRVQDIAVELDKVMGSISLCAENMKASYNTIKKYVEKSPRLQEIVAMYRERRVDKAELMLEAAITKGEPWAISLTLKTLGKRRGYTEAHEFTVKDERPVEWVEIVRDEEDADNAG